MALFRGGTQPSGSSAGRLIWDLPLRVCHWLLLLAVAGSWLTHKLGPEAFQWHVWLGYTTLVLVFFRVVWGFVGPRHARFSSFVQGVPRVVSYVRALFSKEPQRFVGHNPLGALMVIAFLLLLGAQAISGLFANDEIMSTGPLYGYVSDATSDSLSRLHRQLSELLWIAIGVHVAAIALHASLKRDNLVAPMITGRKRAPWISEQEAIQGSRTMLAMLIVGTGAVLLYWLVSTAPEPSLLLF